MSQRDECSTPTIIPAPPVWNLQPMQQMFAKQDDDDQDADDTDDDQDDDDADDEDDDDAEQDSDDDDDSDDDENDEGEEGFDGEYDEKRARKTIDNLRRLLKEAKQKKGQKAQANESPTSRKLRGENLRLRVALKIGMDPDLADRLVGDTEEELLEDAEKLLKKFVRKGGEKSSSGTRQPRPRGGSAPTKKVEKSVESILDEALGK